MKHNPLLIGFMSVIFCQNPSQNPILVKTIGTNSGVFFNAGTNQLDLEGFFEIQSSQGLFGEIWVMQLDRDAGTDMEINSSIGWMREVVPNMILGCGISNYANQNLSEIFLGGNVGLLTVVGFFGIDDTPANFIGIIDLNFGPLKNIPVDLSMMGVKDESGSDLFFKINKKTAKGFTMGYTFSRERFESEETRTFTIQGHTKTWTVPIQKDSFFNTIYFGITF